jgi:hypothetical protein
MHLKNRILVQDRGGTELSSGGILLYVEDLKRGTNKDIGPKDILRCVLVAFPLVSVSGLRGTGKKFILQGRK